MKITNKDIAQKKPFREKLCKLFGTPYKLAYPDKKINKKRKNRGEQ